MNDENKIIWLSVILLSLIPIGIAFILFCGGLALLGVHL